MPGTTHAAISRTDRPTPDGVRDDVDLDRTVWFGDGEAYHRDEEWGPACVDQIGRLDERSLGDAVDEGMRPCLQCEPVDYRPVATDGGVTVDAPQAHPQRNELDDALDFVIEAARRARDLDVDDAATARLQLAECGARLGSDETSHVNRDLVLGDARDHLEAALDVVDDTDIAHPIREALQLYVGFEERRRPDPMPTPPPQTTVTPSATSTSSSSAPIKRLWAGTIAIFTASFAGMALSNADFIRTVETASGEAPVMVSPPGDAFLGALALMFVSVLLVAYATGGSR